MSKSFFHFPLPLLSAGDSDCQETIQRITSWCAVTEGRRIFDERSKDAGIEKEEEQSEEDLGVDFDFQECSDLFVELGFQFLEMGGGTVKTVLELYEQGEEIVRRVEARDPRGKKSPHVFIASDLVWACHDEGDPDWRSFTAICAVNSIIGMNNYRPVLIRREMISARMTGFKSKAHWDAAHDLLRPSELTTSQLRTTLDRLEMAGFFIRVALTARRTYFAVSKKADGTPQDRGELRAICAARVEKGARLKAERALDRLAIAKP